MIHDPGFSLPKPSAGKGSDGSKYQISRRDHEQLKTKCVFKGVLNFYLHEKRVWNGEHWPRKQGEILRKCNRISGVPNEIRTRVAAVKGRNGFDALRKLNKISTGLST